MAVPTNPLDVLRWEAIQKGGDKRKWKAWVRVFEGGRQRSKVEPETRGVEEAEADVQIA